MTIMILRPTSLNIAQRFSASYEAQLRAERGSRPPQLGAFVLSVMWDAGNGCPFLYFSRSKTMKWKHLIILSVVLLLFGFVLVGSNISPNLGAALIIASFVTAPTLKGLVWLVNQIKVSKRIKYERGKCQVCGIAVPDRFFNPYMCWECFRKQNRWGLFVLYFIVVMVLITLLF